jgi:hypothetical protein
MQVTVRGDFREVHAFTARLGERKLRRVLALGVNDTGRQTLGFAARKVAKAGGIKSGTARKQFWLQRATPATLEANVRASGRAIPLIEFQARQTARGVTANAWGSRKVYPGTFIATMKTGYRGVFSRVGKDRFPIDHKWGPSVPSLMAQDAVRDAVEAHATTQLQTNIGRQLDRALFRATR